MNYVNETLLIVKKILFTFDLGVMGNHRSKTANVGMFMEPITRHPESIVIHLARNSLVGVTTANGFVS
jgi:hypothetical protein